MQAIVMQSSATSPASGLAQYAGQIPPGCLARKLLHLSMRRD